MHRNKHGIIACVVAALALAIGGFCAPASAAIPYRAPNIYVSGYVNATAAQTFATTSYADLAAATVTVSPVRDPNIVNAPGTPAVVDRLHITWNADVIKATTTTGTCAIYVNGAIVAATARTIDVAAKQGVISGFYDVANSTTGDQTVKLQCKSGDTAVFTVNQASLLVENFVQ